MNKKPLRLLARKEEGHHLKNRIICITTTQKLLQYELKVGRERGVWVFQCFNVLIFCFYCHYFSLLPPHVNFFLSKKTWGDFSFYLHFFFGLARGESCLLFRKFFSLFLCFSCFFIFFVQDYLSRTRQK